MGLSNVERGGYLAKSHRARFRRLVQETELIIQDWLNKCESPIIAFSGGVDSSVMLHLIRRMAPNTPAVFSDDEYNLPETIALLDSTPNLKRVASRVMHTEWFYSWENKASLPEGTEWIEPNGKDPVAGWMHKNGYDGVAVGIRADENSYRRAAINRFGEVFFVKKKQIWQSWPMAWWTKDDIWTAIHTYDIPYNKAYDRLSEIGIPKDKQRVGPFANWRALGMGQLAILKKGWPAEFDRFAAVHPEAINYV